MLKESAAQDCLHLWNDQGRAFFFCRHAKNQDFRNMLSNLAWLEIDHGEDLASKQRFRRIIGGLRDAVPGPNFRADVQHTKKLWALALLLFRSRSPDPPTSPGLPWISSFRSLKLLAYSPL